MESTGLHGSPHTGAVPGSRRPAATAGTNELRLLAEKDIDWVAHIINIVVACVDKPWRVALEHIDGAQYLDRPVAPHRFAAVVGAVQRVVGGRSRHAQLARVCRSLVLGRPALSQVERGDRIAAAARSLQIPVATVERMLWADLPRERLVELPRGRPSELEVAAFANVQLVQRAVRRALAITLRIWGDAGPLLRGAAIRGLLTTATLGREGETVVEIVGPLALCHRTAVYGRAVATLVPLLAEHARFELTLSAEGHAGPYTAQVTSPALLPVVPSRVGAPPYVVSRLARDLRRAAPELSITEAPPLIATDGGYLCPDLVIERIAGAGDVSAEPVRPPAAAPSRDAPATHVEIVGFWTAAYLQRKLAAYAATGRHVLLCVDESRGCADEDLPASVVGFTKRVDAQAILGRIKVG
jgi:predicted nuclease of restriction endonuclease-like RecB superfamily